MRALTFRAILKQEVLSVRRPAALCANAASSPQVSLFDSKKFNAPALTARLATDAALVQVRAGGA